MMPISSVNNDQNIERVYTKMSEHFPDQNNAKLLSNSVETVKKFFEGRNNQNSVNQDDLGLGYDHMYASNTANGVLSLTDANCQSAESEVKFWKEWLILHLDLIQQQSDEILDKERTILILQQENEMLKERISCMERGAPFQPSKFYNNHASPYITDKVIGATMTQDSGPCDEDNKNCLDLLDLNCENGDDCASSIKLTNFETNHVSDTESQTENAPNHEPRIQTNNSDFEIDAGLKTESEVTDCNNTSGNFGFTITSGEFDPMRNLRMSIRRKRLSNSSVVSNNEAGGDEKRAFRPFRKRRKRVVKDAQLLTTLDQYVTLAGETTGISPVSDVPIEISNHTTLEVPRWRVKVYASCYSMEGTENLDDEVYNKRHSRLETDERRRKRWDVQRIREQRVIEKLKQRQERSGSGIRSEDQNECVQTLWPKLEDIKQLEVSEQLPVAAFGCSIPKITPSEFALPWLENPALFITKKVPAKRSAVRKRRR